MSMDLSVKYKILTLEEYDKLEREDLYFSNEYDLDLIDKWKAKDIINSQYLQIFEEYMNNHPTETMESLKEMLNDIEDSFSMEVFINDYLGVDLEDAPITLDNYLDNNVDYPSARYIIKEKVGDNEFYLLISCRYW